MGKIIGIHNADGKGNYPNLALLKLAAWHKAHGDRVERFAPLFDYDHVYSSKVFSWTPEDNSLPQTVIKGGTGYGIMNDLPDEVEHFCPDYAFAGIEFSMGFLTRGCIRVCPWCIVPDKEGTIRAHADIEEFARHRDVVLMDNNVLAHDHGIEQIEKIARLGLRVDFNQGLDMRLIDKAIARRLTALRWIRFIRMACDQRSQMAEIEKAIKLLRAAGCRKEIFCYVLVQEVDDALERVNFLRGLNVTPFAQPFREQGSKAEPAKELKVFARWVNLKKVFKSTDWQGYIDGYKPGIQQASGMLTLEGV
jgi:hypothetical protein